MTWKEIIAFIVALVLLAGFFVYYGIEGNLDFSNKMDTGEVIQVIITFALVLATVIYVKRTADIAKETRKQADASLKMAEATKQQADASLKMAEEMREQRLEALRPVIALHFNGSSRDDISASFENVGTGPALNLKCYLTHPKLQFAFVHDRYAVMGVGEAERRRISFPTESFDRQDWVGLAINCDYEDVYKRRFRSTLKSEGPEERRLFIFKLE